VQSSQNRLPGLCACGILPRADPVQAAAHWAPLMPWSMDFADHLPTAPCGMLPKLGSLHLWILAVQPADSGIQTDSHAFGPMVVCWREKRQLQSPGTVTFL